MSLGISTAQWLFRQLYSDGIDQEALVRNKPLLQWTDNKTNFTSSKGIEIPCPYVNPQGIGSTNASAAANEVESKGVSFTLPQRHHYAFARIDGDVVRNTINGGPASQFTNALTREVDGATEAIGAEIHQRMYGDNSGLRSLTSSATSIASTTWTLANPEDCQFYEPNMKVVLVNPATGLARAGTAVTVNKVDPIAGTIECSANMNTFTSAAAGDGIARDSMVGADLDGLKAWCPAVVSGADSFLGVNRSTYRTRLAGYYHDASNGPIRNGFIAALAKAKAQVGSMFESKSPFFINPKNLAQIEQTVESGRIVTSTTADKYGIGIEVKDIMGYKFVEDSQCPVNEAFLIGTNAWTRATCGKQPQIDDQDGNQFYFNRATGKLEFVLAHDGNSGSYEPYNVMRVTLPNVAL